MIHWSIFCAHCSMICIFLFPNADLCLSSPVDTISFNIVAQKKEIKCRVDLPIGVWVGENPLLAEKCFTPLWPDWSESLITRAYLYDNVYSRHWIDKFKFEDHRRGLVAQVIKKPTRIDEFILGTRFAFWLHTFCVHFILITHETCFYLLSAWKWIYKPSVSNFWAGKCRFAFTARRHRINSTIKWFRESEDEIGGSPSCESFFI